MASAITRRTALALLAGVSACAQVRRLLPVSEATTRDPALTRFVAELRDAVARRDESSLLRLLDPQVRSSFGGETGIAEFRQWWKLDQPGSKLWPLLQRLFALGGLWDGDNYVFPYVFARFPEDLDSFEHAAITGQGVWLRTNPSPEARGVRQRGRAPAATQELEHVPERGDVHVRDGAAVVRVGDAEHERHRAGL